jgi:two-component system, OmpR family, alkaline phosphatase synthesis response regulator PhoP
MDILIVEDEQEIADLIRLYLEKEGFRCHHCRDGVTALDWVRDRQPDLVILDLMIPGLDGLEVCTRIRRLAGGGAGGATSPSATTKDPYILMLTAKGEEIDRIIGLSTGADDYMVKPFSPRELVVRVRALLRRSLRQAAPSHLYRTPNFSLDLDAHLASRQVGDRSEPLDLTGLEFKLLAAFLRYPGRVWSRSQLIEQLWGDDFYGDERVVDTHIARLRKKIEPDPSSPIYVKTVIGLGYKFEDGAA